MITKEFIIILLQEVDGIEQVKEVHYSQLYETIADPQYKSGFKTLCGNQKKNRKVLKTLLSDLEKYTQEN